MLSPASKCAQRASAQQRRPSPPQPVTLTWGLTALPASSGAGHPGVGIRKGARSAAGRPRALRDPVRAAPRAGHTGGAGRAPAVPGRMRASAPITAFSVGCGEWGAGPLSRLPAPRAGCLRLLRGITPAPLGD
ncbi:hypothetical protein HJG60_008323 [Phyllostomus discolor]|uniref:Uncharacterized protein n=1 Tax=Phyllostomus discolor TaxID=89673 RepID=A0A833Z6X6_9CHIR|nr:hypothetical protein HJG60_008323 [Phyllostomus discolor]